MKVVRHFCLCDGAHWQAPNSSDWFGSRPRIHRYPRSQIMLWMVCNVQLRHLCTIRIAKSLGSLDICWILWISAAVDPSKQCTVCLVANRI